MSGRSRLSVPWMIAVGSLLFHALAAAAPPQYEAIKVPNSGFSAPTAFNDDGLVLIQTGYPVPMIWDSKVDSLYPAVAAFDSLDYIWATGWNNGGQMLGVVRMEPGQDSFWFFWDLAVFHELVADVEAPIEYAFGEFVGLNDLGDVYGTTLPYTSIPAPGITRATVWRAGGDPSYLDHPAAYPEVSASRVTGSNARGDLVGNMEEVYEGGGHLPAPRAVLWRGGVTPEDLGAPVGSPDGKTWAWDANDSLWVVGGSTADTGGSLETHAQLWRDGSWTDLHDEAVFIGGGGSLQHSEATVVNNAGYVGGHYMSSFGPLYGAFLWYDGVTYVLDDLVVNADEFPPDGIFGPHLVRVTAINEEGNILVSAYSGSYVLRLLEAPAATHAINSTEDFSDDNPGNGECDTGNLIGGVPECTLRAAIEEANALAGRDLLQFEIPQTADGFANGVYTITPQEQLPTIETTMTIDGATQPGFGGAPVVVIDGTISKDSGADAPGFFISSDSSKVMGLSIGHWGKEGVLITGNHNEVSGCYIGVGPDGVTGIGNNGEAVLIKGGANNLIGGKAPAERCVLTNNGRGMGAGQTTGEQVVIEEPTAQGNTVENCYIGLTAPGTAVLENPPTGVLLHRGCRGNLIGGDVEAARNVIGGHSHFGIQIDQAPGNMIRGNIIGLNAAGTAALPNTGPGIEIQDSPGVVVGGDAPTTGTPPGNIISGNRGNRWLAHGVTVVAAAANSNGVKIQGNLIGVDAAGREGLGNAGYGVWVNRCDSVLVGGDERGLKNIIAANDSGGVFFGEVERGAVKGNWIGVGPNGRTARPNGGSGVELRSSSDNSVGGITDQVGTAPGNLISGNRSAVQGVHGIRADSTSHRNTIQGNVIGLTLTGRDALGNGGCGIFLDRADSTLVGALDERGLNVISGNDSSGVLIRGGSGTRLYENLIGTNTTKTIELENGLDGVTVEESSDNEFYENLFRGNHRNGLRVRSGERNRIERSRFFANEAQGIDLEPGGVTLNDLGDTDAGANGLQNYPYLQRAQEVADSNLVKVRGSLSGNPHTDYRLDFFTNTECDPSGNGEGEELWATDVTVRTDASGFANFELRLSLLLIGGRPNHVAATATDAAGNTSEFSNCLKVLPPPPPAYAVPIIVNSTGDLPDIEPGDNVCSTGETIGGGIWECTLRAALEETNALVGAQTVLFHIPDETNPIILPQTPLPGVSGPLELNAQTQPGFNGLPIVVVDGSSAGATPGLVLEGNGVEVRGLAVENFAEEGLRLEGTGHHRVEGNRIGAAGSAQDGGNGEHGVLIMSDANAVGAVGQMQGNVIAGNQGDGIRVESGAGNAILNNGLVDNGGLGINLVGGAEDSLGVTENDAADGDTGPNGLQNAPTLNSIQLLGALVLLDGVLESSPDTDYQVVFYLSDSCDASGSGEGETYLGAVDATTNSSGSAELSAQLNLEQSGLTLEEPVTAVVTATATDDAGNTSEFSPCRALVVVPVVLVHFEAVVAAEGVRVSWVMSDESDHVGFHLYRRRSGEDWIRVTDVLLTGGPVFEYVDAAGQPGLSCEYLLEGLTRTGSWIRFGPVPTRGRLPVLVTLRLARNPAIGSGSVLVGLPAPTTLTVQVFDVRGRLVRVLGEGPHPAGDHALTWDGRDATNRPVAAGSYWIQLRAPGVTRSTRMVLLR